jgi:hypothetical protein
LLVAGIAVAGPPNLSGEWETTVTGPQGTATYTFRFDVEGDAFTGAVKMVNKKEEATEQITDGKIDGNNISFKIHILIDHIPSTVSATGIISGDQLKLTIEVEDPQDGHRKIELTLTRKKSG